MFDRQPAPRTAAGLRWSRWPDHACPGFLAVTARNPGCSNIAPWAATLILTPPPALLKAAFGALRTCSTHTATTRRISGSVFVYGAAEEQRGSELEFRAGGAREDCGFIIAAVMIANGRH